MKSAISERFCKTCIRMGVFSENEAHRVWVLLHESYSAPHRHYHNLSHIDRMLAWLDESDQGSDEIELAIWFHDIVYQPMGGDNEVKSARVFEELLGSLVDKKITEAVSRLIIATDPGRERSGKSDEDLLIDIDLTILGAARGEYQEYCAAIRAEYAEVLEDDFIVGREAVLQSFLSGPIYMTDFFSKLEVTARDNIQWEIGQLELGVVTK